MEIVPTIADIVAQALALKPAVAASFLGGESETLCTTVIYWHVRLDDGTVVNLCLKDGKYGAGYARVSSLSQRTATDKPGGDGRDGEDALKDGWSEQDQLQRIVNHFVSRRQAFRIFSDCGLGGYLPFNDERLKEKMLRTKARRYDRMFTKIFLDDLASQRYTAAQREDLRDYLVKKREMILEGLQDHDFEADDVTLSEVVAAQAVKGVRRGRMTVTYRPGLTFFMRDISKIHTLALTDLSRLSRSQTLSAEIGEKIIEHKVGVLGLVESLGWMSDDEEIGNQLMALIIPKFAEFRLTEVLMNAMRGIVTSLSAGRPFGKVPRWIEKGKDGRAHHDAEKVKPIRMLVDLFLDDSVVSTRQVAGMLAAKGVAPPEGQVWHRSTVINTLESPALVGKQEFFGLEWQVWDPLVDEVTYGKIKRKLEHLRQVYPNYAPKDGRNMAAYLLKCSCGSNITYRRTSRGIEQMRCNVPAAKRKANPDHQHVTLHWPDVKKFIDEFMQEHPRVILNIHKNSQERTVLVAELQHAEAEHEQADRQLTEQRANASEKLRQNLAAMGIAEANPEYHSTLDQLSKAVLADAIEKVQRLEESVNQIRYRLDTLVPQDVLTSLEQRIASWKSLNSRQQNQLLLTFFKEWRVEGTVGNEVIIPVLRNPREDTLFPIRLKTGGKIRPIRRFPTVDQYFASIQDAISL